LVVPKRDVDPAEGYSWKRIGYEFDSEYDPVEEATDPTEIVFFPKELRDVIRETRKELDKEVGEDPFAPEPDFDVLVKWLEQNDPGVLSEVGDRNGIHKQFRMKRNEKNTPYLKIQRGHGRGYLHATPTLGRDEFEGVFGNISVI
jgi:hypothetical protein